MSSMRRTSIKAYREISSGELLGRLQFEVYQALVDHGPATCREIVQKLGDSYLKNISPRFTELERLGVVSTIGERMCAVSGKTALVWEVNDQLPARQPEDINEVITKLCDRVERLESEKQQILTKLRALTEGFCPHCMSVDLKSFTSGQYFLFTCNECNKTHSADERGTYKARKNEAA